jgi:catechol 2,3-dioxygenase-like lactoylglutathione lyase family enzyme
MALTHVFAGIPVADLDVAVDWYERLAGRRADLIPNEREAAWQLTETGWVYVIIDPPRAGTALNTLLVDDLGGFMAGLSERGIDPGPIETLDRAVPRIELRDPDGNRLNVGQPLS